MKKNNFIIRLIYRFIIACLMLPVSLSSKAGIEDDSIRIIESTQHHLILEATTSAFVKQQKYFHKKIYDTIEIPGWAQSCIPGTPQLPIKGYLFGIPNSANASVEILEASSELFSPFEIYYTPRLTFFPETSEIKAGISPAVFEPCFDSEILNSNKFYPDQFFQFDDSTYLREQRIGRLNLFPVQYNPATKQIRFSKKIRIIINFNTDDKSQPTARLENSLPDPFEKLLSGSLLNYNQAKFWRHEKSDHAIKLSKPVLFDQNDWYKIIVDEDGIYRIAKVELQNAGLAVASINPKKIKIFYQGQEIPIIVAGEEDGTFNDGDYIEFYGFATKNDYTTDNVFWLTVGTEIGARVVKKNGAMANPNQSVFATFSEIRVHFEENNYYNTSIPNGDGEDHWFWNYVSAPNSIDISVTLNNVKNFSTWPCKLKIEYRGISHPPADPDHHTITYVNGYKVLDNKWDGQSKFQKEGNFTQGHLTNGTNIIRINQPGDTSAPIDQIYVNWIEIEYCQDYSSINDLFIFNGRSNVPFEVKNFTNNDIHVYDITDSTNVKKFINCLIQPSASRYKLIFQDDNSNCRYLALTSNRVKSPKSIVKENSSQLLSQNNQADYLIISHENFYNNLLTLASFRENQGLAVKIIGIQDIYDEFNYGVKNPKAIKDFLAYAYYNWRKPVPTYVLLVGDASYDYKKYVSNSAEDMLPTHLFESSVYNTETSSDNWFGCVCGDDVLADMLIGRLSVRSSDQLNVIIDKIVDYENQVEGGNWNKKVTFVADNADDGGNFEALSDRFSTNYIPPDFNITKLYLRDYGNATAIKNAIISNISNGCLLVNYVGHGSLELWASEKIFESANVSNLTNSRKIPLVVTMSCINGFFHHAQITNCLSEVFMNSNNGGAVACLSPSGFGYTIGDQYLGDGLFSAIFEDKDHILGSAVQKAKLALFAGGSSFHDHISFYNLLGDPALQLNIAPSSITVQNQWNLISLPRIPDNRSVENILASLNGKWKKLLAYSNGSWIGADADIPTSFWTLKEMELGRGYWLQSNDQGEIIFSGTEKSNSTALFSGWNLIGNATPLTHKIADALSPIQGNWKKILHYANGTWTGADVSLPSAFWTLKEFKPGCGYWLDMSKQDTLNISRIPSPQNMPDFLNSSNKGIDLAHSSTKDDLELLAKTATLTAQSGNNFGFSIPKPSGFYGTVTIKNQPAPIGTKITAWQKDVLLSPELTITESGKYNLLLINGDDPDTPEIDGGTSESPIFFKLQTPNGETFASDNNGLWQEAINARLDLSALSSNANAQNSLSIEIRVNDQIVGKDILDGDPISNRAIISAVILGGNDQLTDDNVRLFLNSKQLEKDTYSFITDTDSPEIQGKITYAPNSLAEGEFKLDFDVAETNLTSQKIAASFSFLISNKLSLEKIVNFPNPMQQDTKFTYYLLNDEPAQVSIKIYTVAGRLINVIHSASNQVGYNETFWDGTDEFGDEVANGVYFYKIVARSGSEKAEVVERLVIMK